MTKQTLEAANEILKQIEELESETNDIDILQNRIYQSANKAIRIAFSIDHDGRTSHGFTITEKDAEMMMLARNKKLEKLHEEFANL